MEKKVEGGVIVGFIETTTPEVKPAEKQEETPKNKGGRPRKN